MKTPNKKSWGILLAVLAVMAGGVVLRSKRGEPPAQKPSVAKNDAAASSPAGASGAAQGPAAVAGTAHCRFTAGQTLSYAMSLNGSSTLPASMLGQSPTSGPITLPNNTSLTLDLRALTATSGGSTVLLAHYRDVKSTLIDDPSALSAPFLLKVADSCEISGFARLASTHKAYARTQQALAHELMFTWPAQDGAEVSGEDANGSYLARYRVEGRGQSSPTVKREILSYDAFWEEEQGGPQRLEVIPRASQRSVTLDNGPWLKTLTGRETLAGKGAAFDTQLFASRSDAPADAFAGLASDLSAYRWEDLLPQAFKLRTPRPVTGADLQAREAVKRYTPKTSVERFMRRFKMGTPFHETWPELTTYLEARPEETAAVVDQLKQGEVSQEAAPAFYVALGRARTQESLAALYEIMQSESAPMPERVRAAFAMVDRDDVGVALARDLAKHTAGIDDRGSKVKRVFAREVALALGALGGLHQEDEEMRQVVMDTAKAILAKSDDAVLVRPAFGALANLGDPAALAIAEDAFAKGSPEMRAAAAVVIRRMAPRDTSDIAARWLANETDWNVKRELYSVVSRQMADIQQPASAALIAQATADLATNPGNITRKAIVRILGRSVGSSPEARAALMEQLPLELKKGGDSMYAVIARYLTPEDTREAIRHAL